MQITAEDGYAPLCTFLETVLTMLWYSNMSCLLTIKAALIQSLHLLSASWYLISTCLY